MKNHCLTCKFKPDWSEWKSGTFGDKLPITLRWREGFCKFETPPLPTVVKYWIDPVRQYDDASEICLNCKTWESQ